MINFFIKLWLVKDSLNILYFSVRRLKVDSFLWPWRGKISWQIFYSLSSYSFYTYFYVSCDMSLSPNKYYLLLVFSEPDCLLNVVAWYAPKILILNRFVRMLWRYIAAEYSFLQRAFTEGPFCPGQCASYSSGAQACSGERFVNR